MKCQVIAALFGIIAIVTLFLYYSLPDLGGGMQEVVTPTLYVVYGITHCLSLLTGVCLWLVSMIKRRLARGKIMENAVAIAIAVIAWFYLFIPTVINSYKRTHSIEVPSSTGGAWNPITDKRDVYLYCVVTRDSGGDQRR